MSHPWATGQGDGDTPEDRPVSSYRFLLMTISTEGEESEDGLDTQAEVDTYLANIVQDPTVADWVLYERIKRATQ